MVGVTVGNVVFDDMNRTNSAPALYTESSAEFLNRVAGHYWDQVRELVEDWASHLPEGARNDVVSRLRSSQDRQSTAAFWELYLHETFLRAGFNVQVHPPVAGPRPPDFLVTRGDERAYVEATCVFGTATGAGAGARQQALYEQVERIHSPNFFLAIDVETIGPHAPSTRQLRDDLEAWLAPLDPDDTELVLGRDLNGEHFLWDEQGWKVWFRPIPIRAERRGAPDHRVLGLFGPGEAKWLNDAAELRAKIRSKGNAYGALDAPLVVAVMVGTPFHEDLDTTNALYGTWKIRLDPNQPGSAQSIHETDGYWGFPGSWRHTHTSGILLAHSVAPWRVTEEVPELWLHPSPAKEVVPLPIWRSAVLEEDHVEHLEPTQLLPAYFGLPIRWPDGGPFPH